MKMNDFPAANISTRNNIPTTCIYSCFYMFFTSVCTYYVQNYKNIVIFSLCFATAHLQHYYSEAYVVLGPNTDLPIRGLSIQGLNSTSHKTSLTTQPFLQNRRNKSVGLFTFTSMPIPQQTFGVWAEAFNIMHGWSSSSATHTVSGDGLCKAGSGLGLRQTWTVPQLFRGWVVEGSRYTDWGWVGTGADECLCVIGISRTVGVLSWRLEFPQGNRVIVGSWRVHHYCVRVFLGQRQFAGT